MTKKERGFMRETLMDAATIPSFDEAGLPLTALALGATKLYPAPDLARFVLRVRPEDGARAAAAWGLSLPHALRASTHKDRHVLWQGPDEFLLLALTSEKQEIMDRLQAEMGGKPYSLVDVSHRNQAFLLTGEGAQQLLETGCMLDLDPASFPVCMTTRTLFAKADLTLWRRDTHTFHIELWRSFMPYVIGLLQQSAVAA
jgi:sarcosine oxidase subunit gamma